MIGILKRFSTASNIKLCLSSRPWEVFKDAFDTGTDQRLYLQDLTRSDIKAYVHSQLEENNHFVQAKAEDGRYKDLVLEIVDKAKGVFLWVFLVVRSLLNGLMYADTIPILQARLRQIPSDLEEYFQHMLDSVDSVYQKQTAQKFQVALTAKEPLSVMIYWILDVVDDDPRYALDARVHPWKESEATVRAKTVRRRLDARSKGLLEIWCYEFEDEHTIYKVDFLHRTVRDFLNTPEMQVMLRKRSNPNFNASVALCSAFLAEIKTGPVFAEKDIYRKFIFGRVMLLAHFARQVELDTKSSPTEVLDEVQYALQELYTSTTGTLHHAFSKESQGIAYFLGYKGLGYYKLGNEEQRFSPTPQPYGSFLQVCVRIGLKHYILEKLVNNHAILRGHKPSLLHLALRPASSNKEGGFEINPITVAGTLLEQGADPHELNVWGSFLEYHLTRSCPANKTKPQRALLLAVRKEDQDLILKLVSLLLRYKANPNQMIGGSAIAGILLDSPPTKYYHQYQFQLIELFLSHGADPNQQYHGLTIWTVFLSKVPEWPSPLQFDTMELLFASGADPYAECYRPSSVTKGKDPKVTLDLQQFIELVFTEQEAAKLLVLLKQKRKEYDLEVSKRRRSGTSGAFGWLLKFLTRLPVV